MGGFDVGPGMLDMHCVCCRMFVSDWVDSLGLAATFLACSSHYRVSIWVPMVGPHFQHLE